MHGPMECHACSEWTWYICPMCENPVCPEHESGRKGDPEKGCVMCDT